MSIQFTNTIRRQGQKWVPWQTLSLEQFNASALNFPLVWQAVLQRVHGECQRAMVPPDGCDCLIVNRTLYLQYGTAEQVVYWRRAKGRTAVLALAEQPLTPQEQQDVYASLEGLVFQKRLIPSEA